MAVFEKTVVPQEQFASLVTKILGDMTALLIEKNRMYGGASMDMGMTGVYVHIHDKDTRLKSLIEKRAAGQQISFEGTEDTLRDTIGYATIGLVIEEANRQLAEAQARVFGDAALEPFGYDKDRD